MGHQYKLDFDGQSVVQTDYNGLGSEAGLADDKAFAELFRLAPDAGTIARGIIPYGGSSALIATAGATGTTKVNPFRAMIGSRTLAATNAALNWQDTRSGISVADGATALATTITHAANASGNPRWDALYAIVTIDANSTPVTRKVKNPGTGAVTDESVSVTKSVTVSVAAVTGTPGASPAFPAIPGDSGSIYYVILGYVRIPTGFGGTSTVAHRDVNTVAPIIVMSPTTGVGTLMPANQNYKVGGAGISSSGTSTRNGVLKWDGTSAVRPGAYIPPTMCGKSERIIALDLGDASNANWSHQSTDIVDDSIDWRNRIFKWSAQVGAAGNNSGYFPWVSGGTDTLILCSGRNNVIAPFAANAAHVANQYGFGQSIAQTTVVGVTDSYVMDLNTNAGFGDVNVPTSIQASNTQIILYVDGSTGALKLEVLGVPLVSVLVWLEATAPYENS